MIDEIDEPAFPTQTREWRVDEGPLAGNSGFEYVDPGMTLRQYAAIKLKVPESGDDGLDWMIAKSLRDDFAAKAIPFIQWNSDNTSLCAKRCYEIADPMLEARK